LNIYVRLLGQMCGRGDVLFRRSILLSAYPVESLHGRSIELVRSIELLLSVLRSASPSYTSIATTFRQSTCTGLGWWWIV